MKFKIKKSIFFRKLFSWSYRLFSLKGIVYLQNKTENNTRRSPDFSGNALKLDLSE